MAIIAAGLFQWTELRADCARLRAIATERVVERLTISRETVILELGKIGFASMQSYTRLNADGDVTIDLSKATPFQMAAIQELTIDEYTEGKGKNARPVKRTKIKLYDKRSALVEIGRELGLFGPKKEEPFAERVRRMTDEQRRAHVDQLVERANSILRTAGLLSETTDAHYEEITPSESDGDQEDTE